MMRDVDLEAVADRIRDHVWSGLQTSLGLAVCQVGDLEPYPTREDIGTYLPAILIELLPSSGRPLREHRSFATELRFRLNYLRAIGTGENYERKMLRDIRLIVNTLAQGRWRLPGAALPGALVRAVYPTAWEILDRLDVAEQFGIGHAEIEILAEVDFGEIPSP